MITEKKPKLANYFVRYGNFSPEVFCDYEIVIAYSRSQIKAYADSLRLHYDFVTVAKVDFTI